MNWTKYDQPKKAVYNHPLATPKNYGFTTEERQAIVIGEDSELFITQLVVGIPIGFHKSRLVRWLPTQTELFDFTISIS